MQKEIKIVREYVNSPAPNPVLQAALRKILAYLDAATKENIMCVMALNLCPKCKNFFPGPTCTCGYKLDECKLTTQTTGTGSLGQSFGMTVSCYECGTPFIVLGDFTDKMLCDECVKRKLKKIEQPADTPKEPDKYYVPHFVNGELLLTNFDTLEEVNTFINENDSQVFLNRIIKGRALIVKNSKKVEE